MSYSKILSIRAVSASFILRGHCQSTQPHDPVRGFLLLKGVSKPPKLPKTWKAPNSPTYGKGRPGQHRTTEYIAQTNPRDWRMITKGPDCGLLH